MTLRLEVVDADGLAPWTSGLRALERDTTYPLTGRDDRFFIDHGERYGAFFEGMGTARFLLARDGERAVGLVAGAFRRVSLPWGAETTGLYVGDFKLAPERRGRGLGAAMLRRGLVELARPAYWGTRLIHGAAMAGASGDVRRSFRGRWHPARWLARELGRLSVYFVDAARLESLPGGAPPPPRTPGLDLSPGSQPLVVSTAGRKDLRLVSTGAPWPLVHLPRAPAQWGDLSSWLRAAGAEARRLHPGATVCFGFDERLEAHRAWLAAAGVHPGGTATVLATAVPGLLSRVQREASWVHLATSEI